MSLEAYDTDLATYHMRLAATASSHHITSCLQELTSMLGDAPLQNPQRRHQMCLLQWKLTSLLG